MNSISTMIRSCIKLLSFFWKILLLIFDRILFFCIKPEWGKKKLLLIRVDAIGDFILWLDTAKQYSKLYPTHKIILIGNQAWTDLVKELRLWDEVWTIDRHRFLCNLGYRWHILHRVCKAGFDTVIQPTYSRELLYGDALVRASYARKRIGSSGDLSNLDLWEKYFGNRWYTHLIETASEPMMELKRNAEFMRGLGLINFRVTIPHLEVEDTVNPQLVPDRPYYILFPGASWAGRQWPLQSFAEIAGLIHEVTGWLGLICGGHGEELLGDQLMVLSNAPLENQIGKTSLTTLAALTQKAELLVGNETGAIHIAAAVRTPSICILGGGHFGRFVPYEIETEQDGPLPIPVYHKMACFKCNWKCKYPIVKGEPAPCIKRITINYVWNVVQKILPRQRLKRDKTAKIS